MFVGQCVFLAQAELTLINRAGPVKCICSAGCVVWWLQLVSRCLLSVRAVRSLSLKSALALVILLIPPSQGQILANLKAMDSDWFAQNYMGRKSKVRTQAAGFYL